MGIGFASPARARGYAAMPIAPATPFPILPNKARPLYEHASLKTSEKLTNPSLRSCEALCTSGRNSYGLICDYSVELVCAFGEADYIVLGVSVFHLPDLVTKLSISISGRTKPRQHGQEHQRAKSQKLHFAFADKLNPAFGAWQALKACKSSATHQSSL